MRLSVEELQTLLIRNLSLRTRITWNTKVKPSIEPKPVKERFDSDAERRYYFANIYPKEKEGKIRKLELHKTFEIVPATENNDRKYRAIRYSPNFYIEYKDTRQFIRSFKEMYGITPDRFRRSAQIEA